MCWGSGNLYPRIKASSASTIDVGDAHACYISTSGSAYCWGNNYHGQLGVGDTTSNERPGSVAKRWHGASGRASSVIAGGDFTCINFTENIAVFSTSVANVYGHSGCSGYNGSGQLLRGNMLGSSTSIYPIREAIYGAPKAVWTAGYRHACTATQCWGYNGSGQLGDGTRTSRGSIYTDCSSWGWNCAYLGLNAVTAMSAGREHTCAVASGTVYCWGSNSSGQLGVMNSGVAELRPVAVSTSTSATDVSAGDSHTCAVLSSGQVACWGDNSSGQLGTGDTTNRSTPTLVPGLTGATEVDVGAAFTCAVKSDETVWCWGNNSSGQLGNDTNIASTSPVMAVGPPSPPSVQSISMTSDTSLIVNLPVISSDPGQEANGYMMSSQQAECQSTNGGTSAVVSGSTMFSFSGLTARKAYECRVRLTTPRGTSDWSNWSGIADLATVPGAPSVDQVQQSGPRELTVRYTEGASNGAPITSDLVTCFSRDGGGEVSATTTSGVVVFSNLVKNATFACSVYSSNTYGRSALATHSPVAVADVPDVPTGLSLTTSAARELSVSFTPGAANNSPTTSFTATCISSDGGVPNLATGSSSPIRVGGLTAGKTYTCTTVASNGMGESGISASSGALSAADVPFAPTISSIVVSGIGAVEVAVALGSSNGSATQANSATCESPDGGTSRSGSSASSSISVSSLTVGKSYTCRAKSTNAIGDSALSAASSAVIAASVPSSPGLVSATASIGNRALVVFTVPPANYSPITGYTATCESSDGGTMRSETSVGTTIVVPSLSNGKTYTCSATAANAAGESSPSSASSTVVATGAVLMMDAGSSHTCGLIEDATVSCWGNDQYGQLGLGWPAEDGMRLTPVSVDGLASVKQVGVGNSFSCALVDNGSVYCWGRNNVGQLGNGTFATRYVPTAVTGVSTATQITTGDSHACARLSGGGIKCWGQGTSGQLGDGVSTNSADPVDVFNVSNATQVSAGTAHTCARLSTGAVKCWGNGANGRLGNASTVSSLIPTAASGITTAVMVSAGGSHSCAVLASGSMQCWGLGSSGQLGNGGVGQATTPTSVSGITAARSVDSGSVGTCAVLTSETLLCWGSRFGNSPAAVTGDEITQVSIGYDHSCIVHVNEDFDCWGSGADGKLGRASQTSSATPDAVIGWSWGSPDTPSSLTASTPSSGAIAVSWTAGDNGGSTFVSYTVTCGGRSENATSTSLTMTGFSTGMQSTCHVSQWNGVERSADSSASNAVTVTGLPGTPRLDQITRTRGDQATYWFTPGPLNDTSVFYTVYCDGGRQVGVSEVDFEVVGMTSPITITNLRSGFYYWCGVMATNSAGSSYTFDLASTFLAARQMTVSSMSGSGTVTSDTGPLSCNPTCQAPLLAGRSTTLTATPAAGWVFAGWGGACSGASSTCSVLMDGDKSVTAAFIPAPSSAPGGAPGPTINIANNVTVNVTVTTPVNVQWSPPVVGRPTTASFTAAPQTTYSISAMTAARAAKTVRGSCSVKAGKVMCTIKIPAKGKWVVAITPKKKGKVGKPAKKTFRV
jgi:alpha-tubulin suppressor-like RCC1 family protein